MITKILNKLFKYREIFDCTAWNLGPYMIRWFTIRTPRIAIFIHKFLRSDFERALHDHPWNFIVIPIWRWYIEHSIDRSGNPIQRRVCPIIGTRYRRAKFRHRVELIDGKPSWSIFIRFRKLRKWGFWFPDGWHESEEWWQQHCSEVPEISDKPGKFSPKP